MYKLDHLGIMIDCSRNSVMSKDALFRYLPMLKKLGYNTVMLYTEDTYEVTDEPYFGYCRGRYTVEELKEIDKFAVSIGVELIPCIQTLAHLNAFFRWGKVNTDCNDILLTDNDRTYELIERFIRTASEIFTSKYIHIGMDEAHMLGRGSHLDIHGFEEKTPIMKRHLEKVNAIVKKYDLKPMMWSDMFFYPTGGYYQPKVKMSDEVKKSKPENVIPVYWDYYHQNEDEYDAMIYNHKQLSREVWFAGGAWSWTGFVPHNQFTIKTMQPALASCRKNHIKNVFFTMWGDNGGECSHFAQLSILCTLAQFAKGNEDMDKIKKIFKQKIGMDYDDFNMLEVPDTLEKYFGTENPSKYMLYCDCFNGLFDNTVTYGVGAEYGRYAAELAKIAKKSRKFGYLFNTEAKLCSVLELKYELSKKTYEAYSRGDKEALLSMAENEYVQVEKRMREFLAAYRRQWFCENKTSGFDVQDIRIGGAITRVAACRERLIDYCKGRISEIEELQEKRLDLPGTAKGIPCGFNCWSLSSSANII